MDPQTLWIIALSISTPTAGFVGFAIQLRAVKKGPLENEKLQLEIEALKAIAAEAERRIVQVTTAEVQQFSRKDILFSMAPRDGDNEISPTPKPKTLLKEFALAGTIIFGLLFLTGYFLYDLCRLVVWLGTKL